MKVRILGVMTGTSCDALDAACVEFDLAREAIGKSLWSASCPYPAALRSRMLRVQAGARHTLRELLEIEQSLSDWYAASLTRMTVRRQPDLIAMHGQTIAHHPDIPATWQMGNAALVAERTGVSVASRFRDGDLAAGGQGAPLLPLFHREIVRSLGGNRAIHNIGGISNLTYFDESGRSTAFDTGPGNIWIDAAASRASRGQSLMDRGGRLGRSGKVDERAVERVLKNAYFSKAPPKSTGRDDFPFELLLKATRVRGADLVSTATQITVESIARAYEKWLKRGSVREILVCGGGAKNPYLMSCLAQRLRPIPVRSIDSKGWDAGLVESQGFAWFGLLALLGRPLGGAWTGARGFGPPASITPGKNWPKLLHKLASVR